MTFNYFSKTLEQKNFGCNFSTFSFVNQGANGVNKKKGLGLGVGVSTHSYKSSDIYRKETSINLNTHTKNKKIGVAIYLITK